MRKVWLDQHQHLLGAFSQVCGPVCWASSCSTSCPCPALLALVELGAGEEVPEARICPSHSSTVCTVPAAPPKPWGFHPCDSPGKGSHNPQGAGPYVVWVWTSSPSRAPSICTFAFYLPRFKHMQIRVNAEPAAFYR